MKGQYLVRMINGHPLAILPSKLQQIEAFLQYRLAGGPKVDFQAAAGPAYRIEGAAAVIPLFGVIAHRMNMLDEMSGGTSMEAFMSRFRAAAADPGVRTIVVLGDTPGGSVYGIQEAAEEMRSARDSKRIIAHVGPLMASAGYWLASAASEITMMPSGEVGSIGVVGMHVDYSAALAEEGIKVTYIHAGKYKVEGNQTEPLGEDAHAFLQQRVDEYYGAFIRGVAKGRGIAPETVRKDFGEGRVFGAEQALSVGMIDRIETLDETIRRAQPRTRKPSAAAKAAANIAIAVSMAS